MKKLRWEYSAVLIFLIVLFTTVGYSQITQQEKLSKELKEVAKETAVMWSQELCLNSRQASLMEKNIITFTMKKNAIINSKMREKAKSETLQAIQKEEFEKVRNILTETQFEKYLEMTNTRIKNQKAYQK